jgi:hypothetical protein
MNPKVADPKVPTIFKKSMKLGIKLVNTVRRITMRILSEYILTPLTNFESYSLLKNLYSSIISNAQRI